MKMVIFSGALVSMRKLLLLYLTVRCPLTGQSLMLSTVRKGSAAPSIGRAYYYDHPLVFKLLPSPA